jgi:nicotianamine synthase
MKKNIERKIKEIGALYSELLKHKDDLRPSLKIDKIFHKIDSIVLHTDENTAESILADKKICKISDNFRSMSAENEYLGELCRAVNISKSQDPYRELEKFGSYDVYGKMIDLELKLLKQHKPKIKSILFIGSGPLPLSSVLMAKRSNIHIDAMDKDAGACRISKKAINKLDLQHKIHIIHADIRKFKDLSKYDAIFIAALAGIEKNEKKNIIGHIAQYAQNGTFIILRDAPKLGKLLYPSINLHWLKKLNIVELLPPPLGIINSTIITQK